MSHHLIFEGAELAGKSWLMSRVYNYLEPKYNQNKVILDGCHWFNCDVGIFGTNHGKKVIENYLKIFKELKNKNLLIEKFCLSDLVYSRLHRNKEINYQKIENELEKLNFKIILVTFPENIKLLEDRIRDRLNLYPHYERILRNPSWYIKQQKEYLKAIKESRLPKLIINTNKLPDERLVQKILKWTDEIEIKQQDNIKI